MELAHEKAPRGGAGGASECGLVNKDRMPGFQPMPQRLLPLPALPLGTARSGWLALPPAAEFVVAVSAPVAPREMTTSRSLPVVLG